MDTKQTKELNQWIEENKEKVDLVLQEFSEKHTNKTLILLKWDAERGQHYQVILNKSLQQPKKEVVYLHEGIRMQKIYEEEKTGVYK